MLPTYSQLLWGFKAKSSKYLISSDTILLNLALCINDTVPVGTQATHQTLLDIRLYKVLHKVQS